LALYRIRARLQPGPRFFTFWSVGNGLYQGTASVVPVKQALRGFSPCRLFPCQVRKAIGELLRRIDQSGFHRVRRDVFPMLQEAFPFSTRTSANPRCHTSPTYPYSFFKRSGNPPLTYCMAFSLHGLLNGRLGADRYQQMHMIRHDHKINGAGIFQRQRKKGHNYDPEASDDEAPVRQVTVAPFLMARYPVTVAEYERFVNSGGYQKKDWWTAGGFGQFTEPEEWANQIRYPNRPVTGVSWWEASAYCASIGVRLPSEEEWECAGRCGREGVRYPWGPEPPNQHRANYGYEGSPQAPTPVGMYPEGATPSGIQDMAGNVWEWTSSWYEKDEYREVRGGGWVVYPDFLRVSVRVGSGPGGPGWRSGVSLRAGITLLIFSFFLFTSVFRIDLPGPPSNGEGPERSSGLQKFFLWASFQ